MKFLLLLLILFPIQNVFGKTYYSEYSEFSEFSEEKVEESDTVNVEVERRYKWIKNVAVSDFFLIPGPGGLYPHVNINIYRDLPYSDWSLDYPDDAYSRIVESRTVCDSNDCSIKHQEYRYKDRLYYHYNIVEKESEEYSLYGKGFVKRSDKYKDYYRYQTREKIEIPDDIIITNTSENITDYISSTSDYKIEGKINYQKNGIYPVNIITSFLEKTIDVEVLIEENIVSKYLEYIEELKKEITNLENNMLLVNNEKELLKAKLEKYEKDYLEVKIQSEQSLKEQERLELELKESEEKNKEQIKLIESECERFKKAKEEMNLTIESQKQNILNLERNLLVKENAVSKLERSLEDNKVKKVSIDTSDYKEKYEDVSKKLVICNQSIDTLEKSKEEPLQQKKQSVFYVLFGQSLILLFMTFLLKIKSMKKKN